MLDANFCGLAPKLFPAYFNNITLDNMYRPTRSRTLCACALEPAHEIVKVQARSSSYSHTSTRCFKERGLGP